MKPDRKSIVYRVTVLVIVLIIAQAILLSAFLILGGVLSQARKNAYISFFEKTENRKEYLQREMTNWINLAPYRKKIENILSEYDDTNQAFDNISEDLISIMRSTQATGAFVILNQEDAKQEYPAIYFRDYDSVLNDYSNKDLYMIFGPHNVANRLQIPLDQMWKYKIPLNKMPRSFLDKPLQNAALTNDSSLLGYWSPPLQLFSQDTPVIIYSEPMIIKENKVIGVIGVEISVQHFVQFLTSADLHGKDQMSYFIGYREGNSTDLKPILLTRAFQRQLFTLGNELHYTRKDPEHNVYLLDKPKDNTQIYLCLEEMDLYQDNTPFQREKWYLIGMIRGSSLLNYVYKIQSILMISLLFSIIIGIIGGYMFSYRFTKPITLLAEKVRNSDMQNRLVLAKTGLTEVDELSLAIQSANDSLLESTIRMSRIIDLAELPIGAYEYREDCNYVFVTEQLLSILNISSQEMALLEADKQLFQCKIKELLNVPEKEEENVYLLSGQRKKWVKLKQVNTDKSTIGVIIDVTDDMVEKKDIIRERDYDYLTQIYNRMALHRKGQEILKNRRSDLETAVIMFDLDNLKVMNDTYGHEWGDKYIKRTVKHLKGISEDRMMLGRRSGDEFVVILYDYKTRNEIRLDMEAFYQKLEINPLLLPDGSEKKVHISSGLVWVNDYEGTLEEYLAYADKALYFAKKNKKGKCCEYDKVISAEDI
jgi:diguanylate cyclase (GGDEF) domain